jgi:hypothetical protein
MAATTGKFAVHLVVARVRIPRVLEPRELWGKALPACLSSFDGVLAAGVRSPPPLWPASEGSAAAQRRVSGSAASLTSDAAEVSAATCRSNVAQHRRKS